MGRSRRQSGPSRPVVGLDVGCASLKVAHLEPRPDGFDLVAAAKTATPAGALYPDGLVQNPDVLGAALGNLVKELHLRRHDAACAVGAPLVGHAVLDLPPELDGNLADHLRARLAAQSGADPASLAVSWQELPSVDGLRRLVARAVPQLQVDRLAAAVTAAGLQPAVIDLAPYAATYLAVAYAAAAKRADRRVILGDIGARQLTWSLVDRRQVTAIRTSPAGGEQVTARLAADLGLDPAAAEAVKRQRDGDRPLAVGAALDEQVVTLVAALDVWTAEGLLAEDDPVAEVLLHGGGADPLLARMILSRTGLPTHLLDGFERLVPAGRSRLPGSLLADGRSYLVALGLALRPLVVEEAD